MPNLLTFVVVYFVAVAYYIFKCVYTDLYIDILYAVLHTNTGKVIIHFGGCIDYSIILMFPLLKVIHASLRYAKHGWDFTKTTHFTIFLSS